MKTSVPGGPLFRHDDERYDPDCVCVECLEAAYELEAERAARGPEWQRRVADRPAMSTWWGRRHHCDGL